MEIQNQKENQKENQKDAMRCVVCNAKLNKNAKFCIGCGTKIDITTDKKENIKNEGIETSSNGIVSLTEAVERAEDSEDLLLELGELVKKCGIACILQ